MSSGVKVNDSCREAYEDLKLKHKHQYIMYRLSDDMTEIIIEQLGEKGARYNELVGLFQDAEKRKECRYAVFDLEYTTKSGTAKNKLLFFMWSPETSKVKQKMVYSASKEALKRTLGAGIGKEVQANDADDLNMDGILEDLHRIDRN